MDGFYMGVQSKSFLPSQSLSTPSKPLLSSQLSLALGFIKASLSLQSLPPIKSLESNPSLSKSAKALLSLQTHCWANKELLELNPKSKTLFAQTPLGTLILFTKQPLETSTADSTAPLISTSKVLFPAKTQAPNLFLHSSIFSLVQHK